MTVDRIRRLLVERGVDERSIDAALGSGRIGLLAMEHLVLPEGPRYTPPEVAEAAELPDEVTAQLWRAPAGPSSTWLPICWCTCGAAIYRPPSAARWWWNASTMRASSFRWRSVSPISWATPRSASRSARKPWVISCRGSRRQHTMP